MMTAKPCEGGSIGDLSVFPESARTPVLAGCRKGVRIYESSLILCSPGFLLFRSILFHPRYFV
jgi:hypothetical protein